MVTLVSSFDADTEALAENLRALANGIDEGSVLVEGVEARQNATDDHPASGELKIGYVTEHPELLTPLQFDKWESDT